MKVLHCQLQPARSPGMDVAAAVARLRSLVTITWVSEGEDSGRYVNIGFEAADPAGLWAVIRSQLQADPELAGAAIVVCQGDHGWDDYLVLHHFNPTVSRDAA